MSPKDKPLVWLHGVVKTPPFSRPMASIGPLCHELRIVDREVSWRIFYRVDPDAIVVLAVFEKKSRQTPKTVIETCRRRLQDYEAQFGRCAHGQEQANAS